jgi:cation:H+ antiporter
VFAAWAFAAGAAVSLVTSWLLVSRLERIGERLGLTEALLGMVAALAADAPEITAAISAMTSHQPRIGAGVVLGSNVFNLAALLGLGAVVAGRIRLHRKVVALGGTIALAVALVSLLVVSGAVPPSAGLALAGAVLIVYLLVLGTGGQRLHLPARWQAWLRSAVSDEELELEDAIRPRRGRWPDVVAAAVALVVVVVASVTMERSASDLGQHLGVPEIIIGALVLAAVTSLPNAVAAVYLASRGRGAATLSTALNSNTLNVVAGLLLPGALLGLGRPSGQALLVTVWYASLSVAVLALAWQDHGLSRRAGGVIIAAYGAFIATLFLSGDAGPAPSEAIATVSIGTILMFVLAAALNVRASARAASRRRTAGPADGRVQLADSPRPEGTSLLPGWSARRVWIASMIAPALIAAADAATGRRVILIGLLIAGPCIALLTLRWQLAVVTGAWACGLAVVLGLPDGIWINGTHLVFITAVAIVAVVAIASAAVISRGRQQP